MTIEAELHDGSILEFPDGTKPEVIQATVKRIISKQAGAMALEGMSGTEKFLAGAGKGMTDIARGVGQVLGLGDQQSIDEAKARDAPLTNTGAGLAGDIAGNLAATVIPGVGLGGLATRGAALALPAALARIAPTVGAAATGAGIAAGTTPIASDETRAHAAGFGAAGGAAGDVGARVLSRIAQPIMQSPQVKKLLGEGIVPTPGQAIGQNTLAGTTEQKMESLPLVGQIIQNAKQRGVGELNLAQLKRSVPVEDAAKITKIGRQGIVQADDVLSKGYDDVLDAIGKVPQAFVQTTPKGARGVSAEVSAIASDPDLALSNDAVTKFMNIVKLQFSRPGIDKVTGEMEADIAKRIDSTIGRLARENSASLSADDRSLGLALRALQGQWRDAIRAAAPDAATAARLDSLNAAYANFVRTERAASYVGAREGVFSPAHLQTAVKSSDASVRHKAFAEGRALGQDLSEPAKTVMGNTVADSGSPGRLLTDMLLLKGGAAHLANPAMYTALAASPFLYSRAGSRYMLGDLVPGQGALARMAAETAPVAAQAGRAYATEKRK